MDNDNTIWIYAVIAAFWSGLVGFVLKALGFVIVATVHLLGFVPWPTVPYGMEIAGILVAVVMVVLTLMARRAERKAQRVKPGRPEWDKLGRMIDEFREKYPEVHSGLRANSNLRAK